MHERSREFVCVCVRERETYKAKETVREGERVLKRYVERERVCV